MEGENVQDTVFFRALIARHRGLLIKAAAERLIICVPQSCSLASSRVTLRDVEHHLLRAGSERGEFVTLSGRRVTIAGSKISTGRGFPSLVVAEIIGHVTLPVEVPAAALVAATAHAGEEFHPSLCDGSSASDSGSVSEHRSDVVPAKLHLYFLSRPLEGGIPAPSSVDELGAKDISQFLALLRSCPETEAPLSRFEAHVTELRELMEAFLGEAAETEFGAEDEGASPPCACAAAADAAEAAAAAAAASSPRSRGRAASGAPCSPGRSGGGGSSGPASDPGGSGPLPASAFPCPHVPVLGVGPRVRAEAAELCEHVAASLSEVCEAAGDELLECSLFRRTGADVRATARRQILTCLESMAAEGLHAAACTLMSLEQVEEVLALSRGLAAQAGKTAVELGVKPAYACDLRQAQEQLDTLSARGTPLGKLHVLRDTCECIRRLVELTLLERGADLGEVDFGTDDTLDVLTLLLVQCALRREGALQRALVTIGAVAPACGCSLDGAKGREPGGSGTGGGGGSALARVARSREPSFVGAAGGRLPRPPSSTATGAAPAEGVVARARARAASFSGASKGAGDAASGHCAACGVRDGRGGHSDGVHESTKGAVAGLHASLPSGGVTRGPPHEECEDAHPSVAGSALATELSGAPLPLSRPLLEVAAAGGVVPFLPVHLLFIQRFRQPGAGELSVSALGYYLANYEQSLNFFRPPPAID